MHNSIEQEKIKGKKLMKQANKKIFLAVLIFQFAFFQFLPFKVQADSHTDTSEDQFKEGNSLNDSLNNMVLPTGAVSLSKVFTYSTTSDPVIASDYISHSFMDTATSCLYIASGSEYTYDNDSLSVINTQSTADTSDDALLINYSPTSNPAIGAGMGYTSNWMDANTHYLYVSTQSGLSVINTQGTTNVSDDTLVIHYRTTSSPAIANDWVNHSWLDTNNNYLYISNDGGLSVINTQGTTTTVDDTLVITYSTSSTPAIANNNILHSFMDVTTGLLYISTNLNMSTSFGGLSVINTQGTTTTVDDTLVITYSATSTPAIVAGRIWHSWLDTNTNNLYISTDYGLSVINTQGTVDPSDDTLAITYSSASAPAIAANGVYHSWLDTNTNYLYISNDGGLSVINTQGTATATDDILVITYSNSSTPAIASYYARHSWMDSSTNNLYIATDAGLSVIKQVYNSQNIYYSQPIITAITSAEAISWEATIPENTAVAIQTREGDASAYWRDDFKDGNTSNVSDLELGGTFSVTEASGILTIDNASTDEIYLEIDTGKTDDYFPAGSIIQARVKMTTNESDYGISMSTDFDDYDESEMNNTKKNEWTIITLVSSMPFSKINLIPYFFNPVTDKLEIDWISVISTSGWDDWSDSYADSNRSVITSDTGQPYLQYRAILSTTDSVITPTLDRVTIDGDTADPSTLQITDIINITRDSVKLKVTVADFPNQELDFVVKIRNEDKNETDNESFTKTTDEDGNVTLTIEDLDSGTDYEFSIKFSQHDLDVFSDYSNSKDATTEDDIRGDDCIPTKLTAKAISTTQIDLSWKDNCAKEDGYNIERKTIGGNFTQISQVAKNVKNYSNLELFSDITYIYRVRSYDGSRFSDYSNQAKAITFQSSIITLAEELPVIPFKSIIEPELESEPEIKPPPEIKTKLPTESNSEQLLAETIKKKSRAILIEKPLIRKISTALEIIGLLSGGSIAVVAITMPLLPLSPAPVTEFFYKFFRLFGFVGRSYRKKNDFGFVFDAETRRPIEGVNISILNQEGEIADSIITDNQGRYGFLAKDGMYTLQISKKGYTLKSDESQDEFYGNLYIGQTIEIKNNEMLKTSLAMQVLNINRQDFARRKISALASVFSVIKKDTFIILFYVGFFAAIAIMYFYPTLPNGIAVVAYVVLAIYYLFFKTKSFGIISNKLNKPVPFSMISLYAENNPGKRIAFTVSDVLGRYYLLVADGFYNLKVQGQESDGNTFNQIRQVCAEKGIIKEDVVVG